MKKISMLLVAMAFGLSSAAAFAEAPAEHSGEKHQARVMDCSKAKDPDRRAMCEKRKAAMESCKDKHGKDHRQCMKDARGSADKR